MHSEAMKLCRQMGSGSTKNTDRLIQQLNESRHFRYPAHNSPHYKMIKQYKKEKNYFEYKCNGNLCAQSQSPFFSFLSAAADTGCELGAGPAGRGRAVAAVLPLVEPGAGATGACCSGFGCCFIDADEVTASSLMSFSSNPIPFICFVRFSANDMNWIGVDSRSTRSTADIRSYFHNLCKFMHDVSPTDHRMFLLDRSCYCVNIFA